MREPTKKDLLGEIRRLSAENERLERLVKTQRPELDRLRDVECRLRDMAFNWPMRITELHELAAGLLPANGDDLPSLVELQGIMGKGKERVDAAIAKAEGRSVGSHGTPGAMEPASSAQSAAQD